MGKDHSQLTRFFIRAVIIISGIALLLAIIASPLTRYLIEKHDVEYIGREIKVGRAFVNPLAGTLSLSNLEVYEYDGDTVFTSAGRIKVNLSLIKLISGTYELSSLKVNNPEIAIIRRDTVFNFSDINIKLLSRRVNIRNIEINNGKVNYREMDIPVNFTISEITFRSPGLFWNVDSVSGSFSMAPEYGLFSGNFMFRKDTMDYRFDINLSDMNLELFEPYIADMAGEANLSGMINLDLEASGNFNQLMKGRARGSFELNDLHFGPNEEVDYLNINRILFQFTDINLEEGHFILDSVLIDKPSILYQLYDTLDNFRRMFTSVPGVEPGESEAAADSLNLLKNINTSDYYVHSFAVNNARIEFNDFSLYEKFSIGVDKLNIKADTIDKQNRRVAVAVDGNIRPYGKFGANLSMDPDNEENFDFKYEILNVAATVFNPYLITYSSHRLDHGTIGMHGALSVRDANIDGMNHFLVINPQNTKRIRDKDTKWIPLPLIMAFVRERGSIIDYYIPIKGDLNDPEFIFCDVITDIMRNILVKPPTTPYRLEVKNVENQIEKTLNVRWQMRQYTIEDEQAKFMDKVARFLKENPEARIVVQPVFYEEKEKENILFFEAKKKYFLLSHDKEVLTFSKSDSNKVEKIPPTDLAFVQFLNNSIKHHELLTLQEKCYRFIGSEPVKHKYEDLILKRKEAFMEFFIDVKDRVEILDVMSLPPYNWLSFYDITYKGDIPEFLSEAFDKLYEFNTQPPREEYFVSPRRR
jgi:hypothetical protein